MKINSFLYLIVISLSVLTCNSNDKKTTQNTNIQDFSEGKDVYNNFCINCHMANGEGVPSAFPPLAKSDYLMSKRVASIKSIKYGLKGEITVNGKKYNSGMASQGLSNKEIADVMNYITNHWGNVNKALINEDEVSKIQQ